MRETLGTNMRMGDAVNQNGKALGEYMHCVGSLIGGRRTTRTVRGVIEGIISGETLRSGYVAAFSTSV